MASSNPQAESEVKTPIFFIAVSVQRLLCVFEAAAAVRFINSGLQGLKLPKSSDELCVLHNIHRMTDLRSAAVALATFRSICRQSDFIRS